MRCRAARAKRLGICGGARGEERFQPDERHRTRQPVLIEKYGRGIEEYGWLSTPAKRAEEGVAKPVLARAMEDRALVPHISPQRQPSESSPWQH